MTDKHESEEAVVVRCPKCNAKVVVDDKSKLAMHATCPNGHRVDLVKMV
jgi:DNA-directed RNA polymerase subunit RPC12/RpoP